MSITKLHPIVTIRPPLPPPSHPPFSLFATSDEQYDNAKAGGGVANVLRYKLDRDLTSYFDDAEERKASRNRAVSLPYSLLDQPQYSNLSSFETVPTPQEQAQLDFQTTKYKQLVADLEAKAATSKTPLSDAENDLLQSYRSTVDACSLAKTIIGTQSGFVEVIPDIFGYGGNCFHDLNNVPNIDKIRVSTFTIPKDHPWHLALRFAVPTPEQRETDFQISWGPFKLRIRGGRRVNLTMASLAFYGDGGALNLEAIAIGERQLELLLDEGRITAADADYIDKLELQITTLRRQVHDQKIKSSDPLYLDIHNQIDTLRDQINERKKLKARPPSGVQHEIDTIVKTQYAIYEDQISLNESSENFYGDEGILRLTVLPQERGYLTLVLNGQEPVNIKIPEILKTKDYGTLWEDTRLVFRSNGGSFDWKFLFPTVNDMGEYKIPNVSVPFELGPDDLIAVEGDWDVTGPGTQIYARVDPVADFRADDPRYDFVATLVSNYKDDSLSDAKKAAVPVQEYLPWLYSLRFFINAGEIPLNDTVLWTSSVFGVSKTLNPGYPNPNKDNPVRNEIYSADDITSAKRGESIILEINDPSNTIGFPADGFKGCQIDLEMGVWDDGARTIGGVQDLLSNGQIREATLMNARLTKDAETGEEIQTHGPDSYWRLVIGDLFTQCNDFEIEIDVILDGLTLGQQWTRLLGLRGFKGVWTQFITETGLLAGAKAPKAGPGEKPRKAPRKGMRLLPALLQCLEECGVTDDDRELRARIIGGTFALDAPDATSKAEFSGAWPYVGGAPILAGVARLQDWSQFYNKFTVNGGRDKITGKKLSATITIYESIDDETSPIWIGYEKPMAPIERPDLDTQEDVERACEIAVIRNTKSGNLKAIPTKWLYPKVPVGDAVTIDGQGNFELARISNMVLAGATEASVVVRPIISASF